MQPTYRRHNPYMTNDEIIADQDKLIERKDDLAVFQSAFHTVSTAMMPLSAEARTRLVRTVSTFFDIPLGGPGQASAGFGSSAGLSANSHVPAGTSKQSHESGQSRFSVPGFFSEDRTITPKQFLFEKQPQTDIDRVACLAYYLTHYREMPHFKTLDLSKLNTDAAQIKLSNPTVAVDNAAQAGLLVQSGQGRKQISAIGELYVQALPDRGAAKEALAKGRPRRPKSKSRASTRRAPAAAA